MRRALVIALFSSACTVGPKLVSVPMLESAPVAPMMTDIGTQAPDDVSETPEELQGSWSGRAWQPGNKSWPLTVSFEKRGGEIVARASYPDQRCGGEWHLRSTEPRQWAGEEMLKQNTFGRCVDHGHVVVEVIDEDTLRWRWTGGGTTATATLEKATP